jgi:hypothetical protein
MTSLQSPLITPYSVDRVSQKGGQEEICCIFCQIFWSFLFSLSSFIRCWSAHDTLLRTPTVNSFAMHSSGMEVCLRSSLTNIAFSLKQTDQPPFSPIRSGPKAPSKPSRQKQFPSSRRLQSPPAKSNFLAVMGFIDC